MSSPSNVVCREETETLDSVFIRSAASLTLHPSERHYEGSLTEYLEELGAVDDYRSWNPTLDIKDRLGPDLLRQAVTLMWDQDSNGEL